MTKKYSLFLCALFCLFLAAFAVAGLLLPDRSFSENENRYLEQLPSPTGETLLSAEFMQDFETYVTDQFALRDQWITLKALSEVALGKRENNGVYLGSDETLFAQFAPDLSQVEQNLAAVNKLSANVSVPVYFSLIPDKSLVWADRLPDGAPLADDGSIAALAQQSLSGGSAQWVDISAALLAHADEALYYRTDHHWTTLGAYYGYAALADALGLEAAPLSGYTPETVSETFYGTTWSSAGAGWVSPDHIDLYVPDEGVSVTTWGSGKPEEGLLYDLSYLDKKDKYSLFLGGNSPLTVLTTEQAGPRVLIIRDSYADSLAPFLTDSCAEIHLFDARYNRMNIPAYVAQNNIDAVVVLYSAANFVSDTNVFLIGMA